MLCRDAPDAVALVDALMQAGPELRVEDLAQGAALRLLEEDGRPVLTVEVPLLVQVAGELPRLLGPSSADVPVPVWWVDLHAAPGEDERAGRVAQALAERLHGRVWP